MPQAVPIIGALAPAVAASFGLTGIGAVLFSVVSPCSLGCLRDGMVE